jgi:hypothetical protein
VTSGEFCARSSSLLTDPLWGEFAALPERPAVEPCHALGCHQPCISDRIVRGKLLRLLRRFGCCYPGRFRHALPVFRTR